MKKVWLFLIVLRCYHITVSAVSNDRVGSRRNSEKQIVGNANYCQDQMRCAPALNHFMCDFEKKVKTEKCPKITTGLTYSDKTEILGLINKFRNYLASGKDPDFPKGAGNMLQMTWDSELESFSSVYGSQCGSAQVPDLDPCAKTKTFPNGTRVMWGLVETTFRDVVGGDNGWLSEVPDNDVIESYKPVEGEDRVDPNYSRYTMLAWATTHKIGCSAIKCNCDPGTVSVEKLVCFLGPAGNIRGESVFLSGPPCKNCPEDTKCNPKSIYSSLCAGASDPDNVAALGRTASIHQTNKLYLVVALDFSAVLIHMLHDYM